MCHFHADISNLASASGGPHLPLFKKSVCHYKRWSQGIFCFRIEWVEPRQQGGSGWRPGVRREKSDWMVSQGAEAFESGHTCFSCERPYSPWLAGWHPRAEAERDREG